MRLGRVKLCEVVSPISGRVEVWEEGPERKLLIEGAVQSIAREGRRGYWERLVPEEETSSALILGLGGGTVARWLKERWPRARVVGYELDPAVVRVAKDFFSLGDDVEVKTQDFREAFKTDDKFDLIVVDLYSGYKFLPEAESEEVISKLRDKLNPAGRVAFNRVGVNNGPGGLVEFENKLRRVFPRVTIEKVNLNQIFWGQI